MIELHCGDCIEVMRGLPEKSAHCCVTSPPYWGLRDYGTGQWEGGDPACDHRPPNADTGHIRNSTLQGGKATNAAQIGGYRDFCRKCGARRIDRQMGLERTPDEYVGRMVEVFREVRRVLRDDGTCWVNLGDSYASGQRGDNTGHSDSVGASRRAGANGQYKAQANRNLDPSLGLKPKDLIGIPWRVALALQADGWYLRSDIIWHKPNPMPESVRDRPTKSHEYLFLLSKSERYYFDADAVREPHAQTKTALAARKAVNRPDYDPSHQGWVNGGGMITRHREYNPAGRNLRTVWTVATKPYKGAHFATFPPKLIEPCIKAGCPAGGTVLDPFAGSGTTGAVAKELGRSFVGIDLNPEYLKLAEARIAG